MSTELMDLARHAINSILDGQAPNGTTPAQLGKYGEVYAEMVRAHQAKGTEGARKVFVLYAERNADIAALRAGDPEPPRKVWSVADLLGAEFPAPRWSIPGLLPTGLVLLAGRPKLGKSWLALQMAVAVGSGGMVLGQRVDLGRVLYLALEDGPRRLQDRLRKQHTPATTTADFRFDWQPLTGSGTADLIHELNQQPYSLIVIDTISRALGRADQMDLADMNVCMGTLQRLAIERNVTILLVDHHRKGAGNGDGDPIDDVMGSTGKAGVADAALGLYRKRGEKTATFKVTGRDIEERELAIDFDHETGCWQLLGTASGVKADTIQSSILDALEEMGGKTTAAKLASWLDRDRANVRKELLELVNKGVIKRNDKIGRDVIYELAK